MLHAYTQYFTCIYKSIKFYSFVLMMLLSPESEKSMRLISTVFTVLRLDFSAFVLEDLQHEKGQIYALDL